MKKEDIKIGQKVSFYYHGKRRGDRSCMFGEARMVYGIITKINRVTAEVTETIEDGYCNFNRKPSELTKEEK